MGFPHLFGHHADFPIQTITFECPFVILLIIVLQFRIHASNVIMAHHSFCKIDCVIEVGQLAGTFVECKGTGSFH